MNIGAMNVRGDTDLPEQTQCHIVQHNGKLGWLGLNLKYI